MNSERGVCGLVFSQEKRPWMCTGFKGDRTFEERERDVWCYEKKSFKEPFEQQTAVASGVQEDLPRERAFVRKSFL